MTSDEILLIGAGGHAQSCIDVIERAGFYRIVGLVGTHEELGREVLGYKVIATDDDLPDLVGRVGNGLVAVGQIESSQLRLTLFMRARQLGFSLPPIIASDAVVSRHCSLGEGCVVMHGAIVNAGASVGANTIINSRALIDHGVNIGANCHISTGALVNGDAKVGDGSFVGSGSVIREGIEIGSGCVVGMGLAVRYPLPDGSKYVGQGKVPSA